MTWADGTIGRRRIRPPDRRRLATLTDQLYTHRAWLRRALDAQRLAFLLLTAALIGALFP
ncbi:hypothetical protein [Nonomuraea sp. NPDC050540]|uniref:hypothetical protein n=1 Tax=Nonomuraea sp. NPDC050540 TaxID=3364367 RepID=UPI0037BAEED6